MSVWSTKRKFPSLTSIIEADSPLLMSGYGIRQSGTLTFGTGEDVNLYRFGADQLRTDDLLDVYALRVGGVLVLSNSRILQNIDSVSQDLFPTTDSYYSLGLSTKKWKEGYFSSNVSIDGKVNNLKIALETGGVLGIWYDLRSENRNLAKGRVIEISRHSSVDFTDYNPQGQTDYFGCRIIGYVSPLYSENYTFYVTTDDGVRVWFNGSLVVDKWFDQGSTTYTWTSSLTAGQWYPVFIEHYEYGGSERLSLEWSSTSQSRQVIPSARLAYSSFGIDPKTLWGDIGILGGKLLFGNYVSGGIFDVNLYRSTADVLKTDDTMDVQSLQVGGTLVITNTRTLQNVSASTDIIASGRFPLSRLPDGASGKVLTAQGSGSDPIWADPYIPANNVNVMVEALIYG